MEYTEFENGWEGKKNHLTALRFARNYLVSLVSLILWQEPWNASAKSQLFNPGGCKAKKVADAGKADLTVRFFVLKNLCVDV